MKVLVTGAGGQVGSSLSRLKNLYPIELVGLGSKELDIGQEASVMEAITTLRPDFIINAAAYTAVDKAEREPELAERVNARGPLFLAKAAASKNIPLVHLSTDYVFDGRKHGAYLEADSVNPLGVYGRTKLAGERQIQQNHGKYIILRTSWVFGLEGGNFPKTILRLAQERSELGIVADQRGCPTFADDLARACFHLVGLYAERGNLPWGTYHYAGASCCSWYEFAREVVECALLHGLISSPPLLKPLTTEEYPTLALRPANSVLDCSAWAVAFPRQGLSDWHRGLKSLIAANTATAHH